MHTRTCSTEIFLIKNVLLDQVFNKLRRQRVRVTLGSVEVEKFFEKKLAIEGGEN